MHDILVPTTSVISDERVSFNTCISVPDNSTPVVHTGTEESCVTIDSSILLIDNDNCCVDNSKDRGSRKRACKPELWKRNVNKLKLLHGEEYITSSNKTVSAECCLAVDCSHCRFKCTDKISDEQRRQLCASYYGLADYDRQKDFIVGHITEVKPTWQRCDAQSHRNISRCYYLTVNGDRIRVCQTIFCRTLDLKPHSVQKYMQERAQMVSISVQCRIREVTWSQKTKQFNGKLRPSEST